MSENIKKYWILMADIVSSKSFDGQKLQRDFDTIVESCNKKYAKNILSPLTITLGDEFQGIVLKAKDGFDIINELEEMIIINNFTFKLRYVLVYGEINTPINTEIAHGMLGNGLTYAREQINNLKAEHERFWVFTSKSKNNLLINEAFKIYQSIMDKWQTEADRALVSAFMKWKDYKKVAEKINKTRSQIWKREKNLNIYSYFAIKTILKHLIK